MTDLEYTFPLLVDATVTPIEDSDQFTVVAAKLSEEKDLVVAAAGDEEVFAELIAERAPVVDGRPRMLHIQAVIVHEGVNGNGAGFYAEDLRKVVSDKKLFRDGYAAMIDINHNLQPIGYWYDSETITDPVTNSVAILAKGAIWAWRFPQEADMILANQHREGKVVVSMMALAARKDLEVKKEDDGRFVTYHKNPIFIATSILDDTDPGDPFARGHADEDPAQLTPTEMKGLVLKAAQQIVENRKLEEHEMLDELKPMLEEKLGENADRVIEAITASVQGIRDELAASDTQLQEATATIEALTTQNSELGTTVAEKDLALEGLHETVASLEAKVAELETEVENYRAAEKQAQHEALKQSRLNEVSEPVRARLLAKSEDVRNAILERWAVQTSEEWETTKAEHALAIDTSARGTQPLPGSGLGDEDSGLDKYIK